MINKSTLRTISRKPKIRLAKYGVHGEEYERQLSYLQDAIKLKKGATVHDKLQVIKFYVARHPEVSTRMVCTALQVDPATFHHYKERLEAGHVSYIERREFLAAAIAIIHPDKSKFVIMSQLLARLKECGFALGINTLRDILKKGKYKTHSINQLA